MWCCRVEGRTLEAAYDELGTCRPSQAPNISSVPGLYVRATLDGEHDDRRIDDVSRLGFPQELPGSVRVSLSKRDDFATTEQPAHLHLSRGTTRLCNDRRRHERHDAQL